MPGVNREPLQTDCEMEIQAGIDVEGERSCHKNIVAASRRVA
jgi:hypothetical protein